MTEKLINVETIGCYFESLSDPRHTRNRKHLLVDILGSRSVASFVVVMARGRFIVGPRIARVNVRRIALVLSDGRAEILLRFDRNGRQESAGWLIGGQRPPAIREKLD